MRLIDADRFKEYITLDDEDLGLFKTEKQKQLTISIMEAFLKDIDEQPTIDVRPQWVSCNERLPEKDGLYLTTARMLGYYEKGFAIVRFSADSGWSSRIHEILAWMPLPDMYEVEK